MSDSGRLSLGMASAESVFAVVGHVLKGHAHFFQLFRSKEPRNPFKIHGGKLLYHAEDFYALFRNLCHTGR